jgi:O-antigen ligase
MKHHLVPRALWIICSGLLAASAALFLPGNLPSFLGIAGVLSMLAVMILRRPAWLLYFLAGFAALVSLGQQFESVSVGGTTISLSGIGWGFTACAILAILALRGSALRVPKFTLPFFLFAAWTALRWLSSSAPLTGLKDLLFYSLPPLAAVYVLSLLSRDGGGVIRRTENWILATVFLPVGLYLFLVPAGVVTLSASGPDGVIESRGIALYLLNVLALALSRWRYGSSRNERETAAVCGLLALATIFFTLSRLASLTAVLILALGMIRPRSLRRIASGAAAVGLGSAAFILGVPFLRKRFFAKPSSDLWTMLLSLKTSGREKFWPLTFEHASASPWTGWGPGSARTFVAQNLPQRNLTEYYPHNEYLQVYHDLGIVGLALLLSAYVPLWFRFWDGWRVGHVSERKGLAARSLAAFLAVTAVLVTSVTANTLHYAFVTIPAILLVSFAIFQIREEERVDPPPRLETPRAT